MKKSDAMSVTDILNLYINDAGQRDVFDRRKVEYLWADIVGQAINRATIRRYVDGDVLHVYISSAPLKSEIAFMADAIVKALNDAVGSQIITKLAIH